MNDLTTTPDTKLAKTTSPVLSPELTALLDDSGSPDHAVRQIVASPMMVAEVRTALPALHAVATAKAGEAGVKAVVGRRLATYPQPARSEGEWDAWWADYFDVLSDVSLASLEAGMRVYVAAPDSEFMPKPGKLRELAFTAPCRSLGRYYRAKRVLEYADEPPWPKGGPSDPEPEFKRVDPGEVKAMLADYKAKTMPLGANAKPALPSIAGKPDEGGLTKEMRALIARQQGLGG